MTTKPTKVKKIKKNEWIIVHKDDGYIYSETYSTRAIANNALRRYRAEMPSRLPYLRVVPCTITYLIPKK